MYQVLKRSFKGWVFGVIFAVCAVLATAQSVRADTVTLKDGTVLEGTIVRDEATFLFIKIKIGSIETEKLVAKDDVKSIEKSARAAEPADPSKTAAAALQGTPGKKYVKKPGEPTRVAILNFGLPLNTKDRPEDMVGIMCNVASFKHVIPMLEEDGVDVVVIRIASGGGMTLEMPKFNDLFDYEYKPRFRTVAWIEYSISAACMSPWVLEEIYFMRNGRMGGCTEFRGNGDASKGMDLEEILAYMEKASVRGKKDPRIMRAMQIQEPLSCTVDPVTGQVSWFQDLSGEIIVNRERNVLTFDSNMAMKTKFANGVADTVDELMKAMSIDEYVIVGKRAGDYIDQNIRDNAHTEDELNAVWGKYQRHLQLAAAAQDMKSRGEEVGLARRYLAQIRRMLGVNPNFELMYGTTTEWFQVQEERLKDLMRTR